MKRIATKNLVRRVQTLEARDQNEKPKKRNLLLDLSVSAMASAWTPEEIEELLAAPERSELGELLPGLRQRWAQRLDEISIKYFARNFAGLLALRQTDLEALPPLNLLNKRKNIHAFRRQNKTP